MEEKKQDTVKENRKQVAGKENGEEAGDSLLRNEKRMALFGLRCLPRWGRLWFWQLLLEVFSFTVRCRSMRNASFLAP